MNNVFKFILGMDRGGNEEQEITKHIIGSCLSTSRVAILIIELFEAAFFVVSIINPELFGRQVDRYRFCYMILFLFCFVIGIFLMFIQENFEKNYWMAKIVEPAAAMVLVGWALLVTYIDSTNYTTISPTLFMTMILCIPGCLYITPMFFLVIDVVGCLSMYAIMHMGVANQSGAPEVFSHFSVFCVIETIIGISFLYIRFEYFKKTRTSVILTQEQDKAQEALVQAIRSLAFAIDAKDRYTQGHSSRVADYSQMLAEKMGLSREEQKSIYFMALMHDVGKIGVPDDIINKTSTLSDEEYAVVKQHPIMGYEILKSITSMPELARGARWHHERYDGTGYPDGLSGDNIPLEARIIAVADAYDTMASMRSYRDIFPQSVIKEEIERGRGTQFDPYVANCMLEIIEEDKEYKFHEHNTKFPKRKTE